MDPRAGSSRSPTNLDEPLRGPATHIVLVRPRHELLLLVLAGVVCFLPLYGYDAQDQSRLCLTQAMLHGRLSADRCLARSVDKARYGRHLYSDKAPGLSVLAIPSTAALDLRPVDRLPDGDLGLWGVRILTSGLGFLLCALLVGRLVEGLAPRCGDAALVTFALGTLVAPLAATCFGHDLGAALAFGAFVLAWRGRAAAAGLLAGAALLTEYDTASIVLIVGLYVLARGLRPALGYLAGLLPGVALLLAYDAAAFGSPFHVSYRYVSGQFAAQQQRGFFGIGAPRIHSVQEVLVGGKGLLLLSPVLVAAAAGLVLLARRDAREAAVCSAVVVTFLFVEFGYFLPYGGVSPGPRFFVPALPFLAVGLGPAFARWRLATSLLAVLSIVPTMGTTLVWFTRMPLRETIWGELARAALHPHGSRFIAHLMTPNVLGSTPLGGNAGLAAIGLAAALALALGLGRGLVPDGAAFGLVSRYSSAGRKR